VTTTKFFFSSLCLGASLSLSSLLAVASPGAHGPNGEHLDGPAQTGTAAGSAPRFEAKSETFEMVGRLSGGELSMFINRYASNEPVLQAKVEVESGKLKAAAPFHADQGDYAVADEAFLKAMAQPGDHPLVITVVVGKDADLLDGTLTVQAVEHGHEEHGHAWTRAAAGAGVAVLVLAALAWALRRRRRAARAAFGGAQ